MKKSPVVSALSLFVLVGALASPVSATSLILASEGGWNGFALEAEVRAGFREAGGVPGVAKEIVSIDMGFLSAAPDVYPPGTTLTMESFSTSTSPLTASITPDTGLPKDMATGTVDVSFTIGTLSTDDAFSFAFGSTTSAENAMVDFGSGLEQADAFFELSVRLLTFAPATIPGAVIQLPDLPNLTAPTPSVETMSATVSSFIGGAPFAGFQLPGDAGPLIPIELSGGEFLEYNLKYSIITPYGTDPTVGYTLNGSSSVPEPSVLPLLGVALMFRRRR